VTALPEGYPPVPEPLPLPVVDGHTHLDIPGRRRLDGDGPARPEPADVAALLAAAAAAGVPRAVQIGCDLPAARWTVRAVEEHPALLGGVAVHPNEAPPLAAAGTLDAALDEIEALARHPRIRVVGETGLDWYRTEREDAAARVAQQESFRAHVEIARRLDLPLQVHDRDAHADVVALLDDAGAPQRTVLHCFSGDAALARECAARGWYLSFAGTLTFRNAGGLREALAAVPLELVQVETDAPYLTPSPYRGRPNAPHLVPHTVRCVAEVTGRPLEEVCATLAATAEDLYGPW
jgi:TatD DNase family protein